MRSLVFKVGLATTVSALVHLFVWLRVVRAAQLPRGWHREIPANIDTVILVDGDRVHLRSKAFLYLARHLGSPWRWAYAFRWFPGFLMNIGYRFVAAIRYRIWGRADACELPSPEQRARFLP